MAIAAADLTLDELKLALAPALADAVVFDGWSDAALVSACESEGVDIDAFAAWIDERAASAESPAANATKSRW